VSVPCKEGSPAGEAGELIKDESSFIIYPNPNDGTFTISVDMTASNIDPMQIFNVKIFNELGQLVYSDDIFPDFNIISKTISVSNQPNGIYIIKLFNNGIENYKKLIIEN
jgi:hypothetical protein